MRYITGIDYKIWSSQAFNTYQSVILFYRPSQVLGGKDKRINKKQKLHLKRTQRSVIKPTMQIIVFYKYRCYFAWNFTTVFMHTRIQCIFRHAHIFNINNRRSIKVIAKMVARISLNNFK